MNFFNGFGGAFRRPMENDNCCCKIIWILILLSICGCGGNDGCDNGVGNDNCICWILLLLILCGGCGNNNC